MSQEDQDAIPFEVNKDVLSGATITKSFVPDKKPDSKSPWTSLEVAKIIVGAMTPLLIASIGIYATKQQHDQDVARVEREALRARSATAGALIDAVNAEVREAGMDVIATDQLLANTKSSAARSKIFSTENSRVTSFITKAMTDFEKIKNPLSNDQQFEDLRRTFGSRVLRYFAK